MDIINSHRCTIFDMEADGLLQEATKIHILSFEMHGKSIKSILGTELDRIKAFFQYHIDNKIPVGGHNIVTYDKPLAEKILGIDLSNLMCVDTMALSWYLNIDRKAHGLASFKDDYGVEKVFVGEDEWATDNIPLMKDRCETDVEINSRLWDDLYQRMYGMYSQVKRLVDGGCVGGKRESQDETIYIDRYINNSSVEDYIDRIISFLSLKMNHTALQQETMWEVDVDSLSKLGVELSRHLKSSQTELESIMDPVPEYSPRNKPKKMKLKNRELSSHGKSWNKALMGVGKFDDLGNELTIKISDNELKILKDYNPPNIYSNPQIKNLLFKNGWKPESFKYVRDKKAMQAWADNGFRKGEKPKPRAVPQISIDTDDGKVFCPSVKKLIEKVPKLAHYEKFTLIKSRSDIVKNWYDSLVNNKYLIAGVAGFTNTLRVKHKTLVNLPGVNRLYGDRLRGALIAGLGNVLLGSDLSSLEDRIKQHFMLPWDPEYVKTMMEEGYCPHLDLAVKSGLMTQEQADDYKRGIKTKESKTARRAGKETNYSAQYGASGETVSLAAGVDNETGDRVVEGYKERNWAIQKIADEQIVIKCSKGFKWLINPINGFCYSLRSDKDRFSTLCQGTGSFFFDMWVANIMKRMKKEFNVQRLCGCFHDEFITRFKDTPKNKEEMEKITLESIEEVTKTFLLRRSLGADVQFGDNYSQIH